METNTREERFENLCSILGFEKGMIGRMMIKDYTTSLLDELLLEGELAEHLMYDPAIDLRRGYVDGRNKENERWRAIINHKKLK